jgi:hypothetical protein
MTLQILSIYYVGIWIYRMGYVIYTLIIALNPLEA